MKKKIIFSLVFALLLSFLTVSFSFAQPDTEKDNIIVINKKPIMNTQILLERAKKGVTDYNGILADCNKPEGLEVKKYVTTQKLKEIKMVNGNTQTSYLTTAFYDILDSGGSKYDDEYDDSYSIRCRLDLYWETVEDPYGVEYHRTDKSKATYYQADTQVIVNSADIKCGQTGNYYDPSTGDRGTSLFGWDNVRSVNTPSFNTGYICYGSSSWPYVLSDVQGSGLFAAQESVLKRGTSTWDFVSYLKQGSPLISY